MSGTDKVMETQVDDHLSDSVRQGSVWFARNQRTREMVVVDWLSLGLFLLCLLGQSVLFCGPRMAVVCALSCGLRIAVVCALSYGLRRAMHCAFLCIFAAA